MGIVGWPRPRLTARRFAGAATVVLLAGLSLPAVTPAAFATPSVGVGSSPKAIAVAPSGEYAYITLQGEAKVAKLRVSDSTLMGTIDVGLAPGGIAIEPAGEYAFVANRDSGTVSKIDISGEGSDTVVATLDVGGSPTSVATAGDSYNVYVTNPTFHTVQKLLSTGSGLSKLADIAVGTNPAGIAIDPTSAFAYVANTTSGTLSRISLTTGAVDATIGLGCASPADIAFHPTDALAYVVCTSGLRVVDTSSDTVVETLAAGGSPQHVAVVQNPTGLFALVTNLGDNSVSKIDLATGIEVDRIDVDAHPLGIATTPDGETAFVANNYYDTVSVVTLLGEPRFPTFGAVTRTSDGFTVTVTNFDAAWQWAPAINATGASVNINGGGLITATGLAPGAGATVTVTTSRDGWLEGTGTVSGQASTGAAHTPVLADATSTADGFTVQISNFDGNYTWAATFGGSDGTVHPAGISDAGLITVDGLAPDYSTTLTVTTTRTGYATGTATATGASLPADALTPAIVFVSNDYAEMVAQVTNYDAAYTWSVVNDEGWATIDGTGSITTRSVPGQSVSVTVTASRSGYLDGSTTFTTTPPALVPVAPQDVSATAGAGLATVAWSPPFNDGGSAVTSYLVQYSAAEDGPWSAALGSCAANTGGSDSCQATGLDHGTGYWLRVAAVNGAGTGPWSDPVGPVTPEATAVAVTLTIPAQLAAGQTVEVGVNVASAARSVRSGQAGAADVSLNGSAFCSTRITGGQGACSGKIRTRGAQSFSVVFTADGGGSTGSGAVETKSASVAITSAVAGSGARCRQRAKVTGVAERSGSPVRVMAKKGNRWVRVASVRANARGAWRAKITLPKGSRQVRASDGRTTTSPAPVSGIRC